MTEAYEPIARERFIVETDERGEFVRVRPGRQVWPMLFLPVWLIFWTAGGGVAIYSVITQPQPFIAVWLVGWALGWLAVAGTLVWMFTGAETLRVVGTDLEIARRMLGWSRRWLYQGAQVRNLAVAPQDPWFARYRLDVPFFRARSGSVKFDYGARTFYAAPGLDEAEARMVVDRLARRLGHG